MSDSIKVHLHTEGNSPNFLISSQLKWVREWKCRLWWFLSPPFFHSLFLFFPTVNNMSAFPLLLLCLCTLFRNPQETWWSMLRVRKGEEELGGGGLICRNYTTRDSAERWVKRGICDGAAFPHHYYLKNILVSWETTLCQRKKRKQCYCMRTSLWYNSVTHNVDQQQYTLSFPKTLHSHLSLFSGVHVFLCVCLLLHILP